MKLFLDTNVLIAATVDEPGRGEVAVELLDGDHQFCTSVFDLMEYRTVLAKKKRVEQDRVEELLAEITGRIDVYFPDAEDLVEAYELQADTLLYPLDCVTLATALLADATMVTFDTELLEHGAESPDEVVR